MMSPQHRWTGAYDKRSFLEPLHRRRRELEPDLERPGVDGDSARTVIRQIEELGRFIQKIKQIDGPSPLLRSVHVTPPNEHLFELREGSWRAYYLINHATRAYVGILVTHSEWPVSTRLEELQAGWPAAPGRR